MIKQAQGQQSEKAKTRQLVSPLFLPHYSVPTLNVESHARIQKADPIQRLEQDLQIWARLVNDKCTKK